MSGEEASNSVRRYVVANSGGEIVRTVSCLEDQAAAQALPGEVLIEDPTADSRTHYVSNGALVAYSQAEMEAKAYRPGWTTGWDNATMAWIDPRTLADHKAAKWEAIKAEREQREFGGFTWDGSTFDSDSQSQSRIMGAAQLATLAAMAQQVFFIDWTLAGNTVRTLSGTDMIGVGQALGVHVGTQHAIGRTLRAAIEFATTTAEVEAVTWPS